MAGVDEETLRFAFDVCTRGPRRGCRLDVERVPVRLSAARAGPGPRATVPAVRGVRGPGWELLSGRELRLASLDLDDGTEEAT